MTPALTFAAFALTLLTPFWVALSQPPRGDAPVLVVLPPWADAGAIITQAGGRVIGPEIAPFAALASSDDAQFVPRLNNLGAWAVRDGRTVSQLCGVGA
ncbi:MAG: hypothetical protein MUC82_13170 [Cypionkella sp.]|jgi:hypothetical protein|nr:hypothetical protein [Cypionkella sp.]